MGNRELINKFLSYLKVDGRSVLTLSAYAADLKQWEKILGDKKIINLTNEDTARLPQAAEGGLRNNGIILSPNSLARKVTSIREFLRWGYRKGYLKNDLAKEIEIPRRKVTNPPVGGLEPLSSNKLTKLRRSADVKERLVLELILGAGLKLSEIVKLRMKNLNHRNSLFVICDSKLKIPITGQLQQALEYYLAAYSRGPRSTLIFSERTGREITARTANNILNKLAKKAGVKNVTARNLRRK